MTTQRSVMALDANHDIYLDAATGYVARVYNSDAVLQTVKTRLLLVSQEWFLNLNSGLPWFTEMVGKNPNLFKIRSYIARQILGTDGVIKLKKLTLDFDKPNRKLVINFEYTDEYGETITGNI
jgi:hypothetical protein